MKSFPRKLHGGRSEGHSPAEFEPRALVMGSMHEMEHTDDPETAMEIAMDHLIEHPDYYEVLSAMEAKMAPPSSTQRLMDADEEFWIERDTAVSPRHLLTPNFFPAVAAEGAVLAREAPAMAIAVRSAAPEIAAASRALIPRTASWIGRAVQWFREGASESKVVQALIKSGIPKRAAIAIKEAAEAFLAAELQAAATKAASGLVKRRHPPTRMTPNAGNYVWIIDDEFEPLEGPFGPHDLTSSKHFARIGATKGRHHRAISRGVDPTANSFSIIRIYQSGSGARLK